MSELPLPLFPSDDSSGEPGRRREPWALPHPVPTTLLALWPGPKAPNQETAAEALFHHAPEGVLLGELPSAPDGSLWTLVADLPAPIDSRVVIFAERADPQGQVDLDESCKACRWVVGVELLLPRTRLLRSLVAAMRIADAITPGTPAILDVPSSTWHGRDSLAHWFLSADRDPPEWLLWTAHAATLERDAAPGTPHWIRTAGLWRCGLPELELLEVPTELLRAGISLIHGVAELLLDEEAPSPGTAWPIGADLEVALVPWQEVAPLLPRTSPGSPATRQMQGKGLPVDTLEHPFGGVRAVICDPVAIGTLRKVWAPPRRVLDAIVAGKALLHQSQSAARRTQRLAQRMLPHFLDALRIAAEVNRSSDNPPLFKALAAAAFDPLTGRCIPPPGARVEAGAAPGSERGREPSEDSCEHLWIAVTGLETGLETGLGEHALRGTLLNDPSSSASSLRAGAVVIVPCHCISDWQIVREGMILTPDEAQWIAAAVRDWQRGAQPGANLD